MPTRFHLDEHVDPAIAVGLRRRGFDVTTPREVGLLGAADVEHIAFALREDRVIVTHDRDYLVEAGRGTGHAGIAYCHQHSRTIGQIVRQLVALAESALPQSLWGRVEFL